MTTIFGFILVATGLLVKSAVCADEVVQKKEFDAELQCRRDLHGGSLLPILIMIPALLSFVYLIVVGVLVWFVRKKLRNNIDGVVEKTHAVMDAVLVALIPKRVLGEIGSRAQEKKGKKED